MRRIARELLGRVIDLQRLLLQPRTFLLDDRRQVVGERLQARRDGVVFEPIRSAGAVWKEFGHGLGADREATV